jgi:hypothetical protein
MSGVVFRLKPDCRLPIVMSCNQIDGLVTVPLAEGIIPIEGHSQAKQAFSPHTQNLSVSKYMGASRILVPTWLPVALLPMRWEVENLKRAMLVHHRNVDCYI